MKYAISLLTIVFASLAFADQQAQPPVQQQTKTIVYCDYYAEDMNNDIYMDFYMQITKDGQNYTNLEIGLFKANESAQYPDYLWPHTSTVNKELGMIDIVMAKDEQNTLKFSLIGSDEGITLSKTDGAVDAFQISVEGTFEGQDFAQTFQCYDPTAAQPTQQQPR